MLRNFIAPGCPTSDFLGFGWTFSISKSAAVFSESDFFNAHRLIHSLGAEQRALWRSGWMVGKLEVIQMGTERIGTGNSASRQRWTDSNRKTTGKVRIARDPPGTM
jgi:hypothetical protein